MLAVLKPLIKPHQTLILGILSIYSWTKSGLVDSIFDNFAKDRRFIEFIKLNVQSTSPCYPHIVASAPDIFGKFVFVRTRFSELNRVSVICYFRLSAVLWSVNCCLIFSNNQKSHGARSGEYGGWSIVVMPSFSSYVLTILTEC